MHGKVIVITGASGGIGAELASIVAARGASVVLAARREPELREVATKCGARSHVVVADVTKREDVERIFREATARFGHVDVWVNNAGRGISKAVSQLSDEDFDDMMSVNVKSALYGMQVVLPHFRDRRRGHIINVSSMLGRVPFAAMRSAYSAAKHALNALTSCLRLELGDAFPDIHVSTVTPPIVATEFGINARHGGLDSRTMPGAQPVAEVGKVIADLIESPRADVYTRPDLKTGVVSFYAAEDMGRAERVQLIAIPATPRAG